MASKNGRGAAVAPSEMGTFRVPLETPEPCGEISIAEGAEIKARSDLAIALQKKSQAAQDEFNELATLRQVVENERQQFMKGLLTAHGLKESDEYTVNPETGIIHRIATTKPVEAADTVEPLAEAEASPEHSTGD